MDGPIGRTLVVRRPPDLGAGMHWVTTILDDAPGDGAGVTRTDLAAVDATTIDVPLRSPAGHVGAMRLLVHPSATP